HPTIVPVYDFGEYDSQPYLVMRYMMGGSLNERLKRGPLAVGDAFRIIERIAQALNEIHARGIIHRDLKPSNILFDQRDEPFISDFGTAKPSGDYTQLTDTGGAVGTPAYMSPEQLRGNVALDGRSDIYTLGVLLFQMLSGVHPYQTDTPIGVALKHVMEPVPRILDTQPNLPASCQPIISRAMAKERERRYQTAAEMAATLANVRAKLTTGAFSTVRRPPRRLTQFIRTHLQPKRPSLPQIAVFLVMLVFMTGLGMLLQKDAVSPTILAAAITKTPTTTPTAVPTETVPPTPTNTSMPTSTAVPPSVTPTVTVTPSPQPTATPTITTTNSSLSSAVTLLPSSIYTLPNANSTELDIVNLGESITVLGRADTGLWLYVQTEEAEGYAYGPRFEWNGDFDSLDIISPAAAATLPTSAPASSCEGSCPILTFDFYPVGEQRCEAGVAYHTVYMRGQGGDGNYTYYYEEEYKAGPLTNEGFGFEVNNLNGPLVISWGKVVSGDGQEASKQLYIADLNCG
ncbi:MAG: serine/threonine-protein kinase, partial [Anaerolineae bacterium]